jgi:hypothetical protein
MNTTMVPGVFEKAQPLFLPEILLLLCSLLSRRDLSRACGGKPLVLRQVKKTTLKQFY